MHPVRCSVLRTVWASASSPEFYGARRMTQDSRMSSRGPTHRSRQAAFTSHKCTVHTESQIYYRRLSLHRASETSRGTKPRIPNFVDRSPESHELGCPPAQRQDCERREPTTLLPVRGCTRNHRTYPGQWSPCGHVLAQYLRRANKLASIVSYFL